MKKELLMYTRTIGCPYVTIAKRVLGDLGVTYRELYIDKDPIARQRVRDWTGFLSVPTIVLVRSGEVLPIIEPTPLPPNTSPQGIDRGMMITEPREQQLRDWLRKHSFID